MNNIENKNQSSALSKKVLATVSSQKFIVFLVVIVLFVFFSVFSEDFRKYTTVLSMLDYSYYLVLLAIGVTFPLITGGVDLSIGTGMICYSLAGGYLIVHCDWPVWAGMLVTVAFGLVIGLFNGGLVSLMNLPPFLATLCTCMITRGLGSLCSKGFGIPWPISGTEGSWFRKIFGITINNTKLPIGFIWMVLLVIIMGFVLNHTKVGRYTIAIGSNKEAAILSGINVKFYHTLAYVISGLFAGLAAIAYSAVVPTVQPGTGAGVELEAIGGAIIGGVSASGGVGSIAGSFIGVFVICILKKGLPFIGLEANWNQVITGIVLIAAVLIDILKKKRTESK